ncbi:MAG: Holliday junction branch migration protein RuvA [Pseudomonadota bacterium]
MIAQLTGKLAFKDPQHVIVNVSGVGYRVFVSFHTFSTLPEIGQDITIYTHTHLREDQLTLFGFMTSEEKEIFQKVISISGVGPKMALTILSGVSPQDLVRAIITKDLKVLQAIPGVGKKTSERIVIELQDKLKKYSVHTALPTSTSISNRLFEDVVSALTNLGYQRSLAEEAFQKCAWDENTPLEKALRQTLKEIAKK